MALKLARDDRQSVLQVGSYRTVDFENIATGGISTPFMYDTVVRIASYIGDNWITRSSTLIQDVQLSNVNEPGGTIIVGGAGTADANGEYVWDADYHWTGSGLTVIKYIGRWEIAYATGQTIYTNIAPSIIFPLTGWVKYTGTDPVPDSFTAPADPIPAVDGEGLLLPELGEITMLLYKGDVLSTIGGSLNIVPIAK